MSGLGSVGVGNWATSRNSLLELDFCGATPKNRPLDGAAPGAPAAGPTSSDRSSQLREPYISDDGGVEPAAPGHSLPRATFSWRGLACTAAVGLSVAAACAGCVSGTTGSARVGVIRPVVAPATGWARYFFPARAGYSCELASGQSSQSIAGTTFVTSSSLTDTVEATGAAAAGEVVSVKEASTTTSSSSGSSGSGSSSSGSSSSPSAPSTADVTLRYLVANDGSLLAPQQNVDQGSLRYRFSGFVVYPSVQSLRAGESRTSTIYASMSATTPAVAKQLAASTNDGSSTLRLRLTFKVVPAPTRTVRSPAGIFDNTVGVTVSMVSAVPLNAAHGVGASGLSTVLKLLSPASTLYWAQGVGLVEALVRSPFGTTTLLLTGCHP